MATSSAAVTGRLLAALCVLLLGMGAPGAAEYQFQAAYPDLPLKGPAAAAGAVIWSHGVAGVMMIEATNGPVPVFVALLRDQGWDVFRLNRPRVSEEVGASTRELLSHVAALREQGYRKVVLAGQSAGAWISLTAAAANHDVHAVIANAPAYYGTDHPAYMKNAWFLYEAVDAIRDTRVMTAVFAGDPYDPGGRGPRLEAALSRHAVPHLIIDQPPEFSGHGAGNSGLFARRFGACVLAVAGDGPVPSRGQCESQWGQAPSRELILPGDLAAATMPGGGGAAAPFLGRWYGYYDNGRETMLVIERAAGADIDGVYAVGPSPDRQLKAMFVRRHGHIAGDTLSFVQAGEATLRYQRRPDGLLAVRWIAPDDRSYLDAVLRRLP